MKLAARILALFVWSSVLQAQPFDLVISNGRVMDPESGLDAVRHVGIRGGTIEAVSETLLTGRTTIDAAGRVVAPGLIDLNTYQHGDPFFRLRAADGVTSVLYLEDGAVDVAAYYDALEGRALIHHGIAVGHGSLRDIAAGDTSLEIVDGVAESGGSPELKYRPLTAEELKALAELVEEGLREGAVAVGFGIEYAPGATHSEILRMLEIAKRHDASAHLHLRKWDKTQDWGQFFEVFGGAIHTGGDLHINHLQSIAGSYTGKCLDFIDRARSFGLQVTTECYPYTAGLTFIESALFDDWQTRSDLDRFEWPETGERLTRETFLRYRKQGGVVIIHPQDETAQEAAVRTCLAHPLPMIASDGAWDNGKTHPRSAGTNSRVLGRYVRQEGVLSLMEAIRKMRPPFMMPAWGLYTTAMDYARFLRVWLDQGRSGDSRLLSTQTTQAALTQDVEPLYAMQWETWGRSASGKMPLIFGHGGATGPKAWVVPDEDLMIVFFTQAARHSCVEQLSMLAGRLGISPTLDDHPLYGRWRAPASKVDPSTVVLTRQQRDRYVGWYDVAGRVARVWVDQGVLALTRDLRGPPGGANDLDPNAIPCGSESPPWKTVHLVPLGDHRFAQGRYVEGRLAEVYWPDVSLAFSFEDGEITGYEIPYAVVKETAARYRLRVPPPSFAPVPLSPVERARFLGVYAVAEAPWAFRVLDRKGQLVADWAGSLEPLVHGGGNLFKAAEREIFYFFSNGSRQIGSRQTEPGGKARNVTIRLDDGSVVTARRLEDGPAADSSEDSLLITGVSIIDASAATASATRDILIADGKILEVAPAGSIPRQRAASVLPAEGMFAMPGLIDVHAHIGDGGLGEQSKQDRENALAQFVRYGVTTIFAPGGGGGNDDQLARWKERCGTGELLCPGVYGSGALITAPGSHPIGTIWNLPDDVDPAVVYQRGAVAVAEDEPVGPLLDRKLALGADAVKIIIEDGIGPRYPMPRLSNAKIAELVEASHQRGLKVFAHVSMPEHVADGVAGGIDGVMHSAEEAIPDAILAEMARREVFYVATLALCDRFFDLAHGRFEQEAYATAGVSKRALASLEDFRGTPFETPEQARPVEAAVRDNLRRAAAAGVPLALGTDVNNPHVFPGYSVHEELALMVEAGLTPTQALAAATTGGASFLGEASSLGRIAPGYEADLIILRQNPLDDVLNTRTLYSVIHDGRVVDDVVSTRHQPKP